MNSLETVFRLVLDASWRGGSAILVLLAIRPLWRRSAPTRMLFGAWIVVALCLLIPFAVPVAWNPFHVARIGHLSDAMPSGVPASQGPSSLSSGTAGQALAVEATAPKPMTDLAGTDLHEKGFQAAAALWLSIVVLLSFARLIARWRFARRIRRSTRPAPLELLAAVDNGAQALGNRPVRVIVTEAVGSPALFGVFRPALLFPPGLAESLDSEELRLVVMHEIGHCRHHDSLARALMRAAAILHWFNPLVWLGIGLSKDDCEIACDEFVLKKANADEPAAYGRVLLKILGIGRYPNRIPVALSMIDSKRQLAARIRHIAGYRSATILGTLLATGLFGFVTLLGVTTAELRADVPTAPANGDVVQSRGGYEQTFEESRALAADGTFALDNANGPVSIRTWDQAEVRIAGTKHASSEDDLRAIEEDIDSTSKYFSIKTRWPSYSGFHWFGGHNNWVELTVTVPKGVSLDRIRLTNGKLTIAGAGGLVNASNVNGLIEIDGAGGEVNASNVNGTIRATGLAHNASLKTVNGSIYAEFPGLQPQEHLTFDTINGSIVVCLPKTACASVRANTLNGVVRCELPMEMTSSRRGGLSGQIGDGTGGLTAHSINGSIKIKSL